MTEAPEKNIRFKAILIYVVVALICSGMIIYMYKLRNDIDDQKRNIEEYYKELSFVNQLVDVVNASQSEVNLYVSTRQTKHYRLFIENLSTVEQLMDSLGQINPLQNEKLQQVNNLLLKKGKIVSNLNKQLTNKNPIESIDEILRDIDPFSGKDTVLLRTTVQDTTVYSSVQKGFWEKFIGLFSSSKNTDSVTTVTSSKQDLMTMPKNDYPQLSELTGIAEQAKEDYVKRISSIERNINNLIAADQEISFEITTLLIDLYSQTFQTRLDEIQKSEQLIRDNNTYSIVSSFIALVLIFIFILLIISDVNKSYLLRKDLEKANATINQIMDSRHKLLLSVSHDIKTPLNSILGTLGLKDTAKEFHPQDFRIMKNSGEHILALLNNLLEFSSIEQGSSTISKRDFNVYELCLETVEMFIPLTKSKNLTLSYFFDFDKNLTLSSDPLKIKQILINILSNSVKYTIKGSIRFNVEYSNNILSCDIQDTGVGIPQSQINTIFQPFSRIDKNSYLSEGSGLGLFVVKGLVDLLQGNIDVSSEVGKGTRTEISLPAEEVVINRIFTPKKILVVDDDRSYLIILRDMLLKLGHNPSICNNADEFEKQLPDIDRYDEILTDMEMEHFNGIDVLKKIKESGKNIPVSIITAREDIKGDDFIQMGFKAHIRKPVSISDLGLFFGGEVGSDLNFKSLAKMLEEDSEALHEVLTSFVDTTTENIDKLRTAVLDNDFKLAQFICHKMIPMFIQIDAVEKLDILKKINAHNAQTMETYTQWEEDILVLIEYAEQLIIRIKSYLNAR